MTKPATAALTAPHQLSYTYKRSLGKVLSGFFTALRDRRFLGVRRANGRVLFPAKEYDPETSESLSELVEADMVPTAVALEYAPNREALASRLKGVQVRASTLTGKVRG